MAKMTIDGDDLYYESHGAGFPVLLISGLGGAAAAWQPQIDRFAESYQVIVYDHRGTNRSQPSRVSPSIERMAADAVGLMDGLDAAQAHVVGFSTGGVIAQTLAIDHAERVAKLVLVSTLAKADRYFRYMASIRGEILRGLGAEAYLRATPFFAYPGWWINQNWPEIDRSVNAGLAGFPPDESMAQRMDMILNFDRTADLDTIAQPTLVLSARNDLQTPPYHGEELARRIPHARLEILEDGAHACNRTQAKRFNAIVLEFLGGA